MTANDLPWRVSVATLNRVVFQRPQDGTLMLALERKATLARDRSANDPLIRVQPFGGAVRIRNPDALRDLIGDFGYDSERSRAEQDFRILIRPADWEPLKQFCLQHLSNPDDAVMESDPCRELVEEFADALQIDLQPDQYVYQPIGFVVENDPTPTDNIYDRGHPTVRIYRTFEVRIVDDALRSAMQATSERYSDWDLQSLVLEASANTGKGRANTILTLPLKSIIETYLAVPPHKRYAPRMVEGHRLDASVLAILENIEVPQFQRL